MRPYFTLIFAALVLAFFSGFYILKFQMPEVASRSDILEISDVKLKFQKSINPYAIVNFSSIYYSKDQRALLSPSFFTDKSSPEKMTVAENCDILSRGRPSSGSQIKSILWKSFVCNQRKTLPRDFLQHPPYVHKSGNSYAYLVYRHQKKFDPKGNWKWVRENLSLFHVKELKQVQREIGPLGGFFGLLASLSSRGLGDLTRQEGTILTKDFLLARITYPSNYDIMEYRFYLREDLKNFLENTRFQVINYKKGVRCVYKDGPICWRYNVKHLFNEISKTTLVSFLGVMLILALVLWILFSKIKQDKREEERRKIALQVLSHEFRTPVASLLLSLERVNRRFNELDETTQSDFLRMSSEIYRLQRLTEKSKQYLRGAKGKHLINCQMEEVSQINEVIEDVVIPLSEDVDASVKFNFNLDVDYFVTDIYWFQIIVKNLVENSFFHGVPPVEISCNLTAKCMILKISDKGNISKSLSDLTREFSKGNKSSGSGLGLSIVSRVICELGGSLQLETNPTTFIIKLPNRKV